MAKANLAADTRRVPPHPHEDPAKARAALLAALAQQTSIAALNTQQEQERLRNEMHRLALEAKQTEEDAKALAKQKAAAAKKDPANPNYRSLQQVAGDASRLRSEALRLKAAFTEAIAVAKSTIHQNVLVAFATKAKQLAARLKTLQTTLKGVGKAIASIGSSNVRLSSQNSPPPPSSMQPQTSLNNTTMSPIGGAAERNEQLRKAQNKKAEADAAKTEATNRSSSADPNEAKRNRKSRSSLFSSRMPGLAIVAFQVSPAARAAVMGVTSKSQVSLAA